MSLHQRGRPQVVQVSGYMWALLLFQVFCLGAADPKTNATAKAEARAEVAEAQEAQEKGLLVDALAKLKEKAEALSSAESELKVKRGVEAKAEDRERHIAEQLRKVKGEKESVVEEGEEEKKKEQMDLGELKKANDHIDTLEKMVHKVKEELRVEKKQSNLTDANLTAEMQRAHRLRLQVLQLAFNLSEAKQAATDARGNASAAKHRFQVKEHNLEVALHNRTAQRDMAEQAAGKLQDADHADRKALKELKAELRIAHKEAEKARGEAKQEKEREAGTEDVLREEKAHRKNESLRAKQAQLNATKEGHDLALSRHALAEAVRRANATWNKEQLTKKQLSAEESRLETVEAHANASLKKLRTALQSTAAAKKSAEGQVSALKAAARKREALEEKEGNAANASISRLRGKLSTERQHLQEDSGKLSKLENVSDTLSQRLEVANDRAENAVKAKKLLEQRLREQQLREERLTAQVASVKAEAKASNASAEVLVKELRYAEAVAARAARAAQAAQGAAHGNATVVAKNAELAKLSSEVLRLRGAHGKEELMKKQLASEGKEERSLKAALAKATSEDQAREEQIADLKRGLGHAKEREALLPVLLALLALLLLGFVVLRRHFMAWRAQHVETILRLNVERLKALKMLEEATVPLLSNGGAHAKD